ncbi:MAG: PQQ-binding-like beta-propeller repeat protein [Verrucomicrobia bacterium]|jgi:outer membrane protein assembly factor BamB|nr:PQQ-binding-like beta-propeller repeat protein [Verrucomicrobiota bacterium]
MSESKVTIRRSVRWWPALVVLALASLALVYVWGFRDVPRQEKNINSAVIGIATAALVLLWWCFFSRTRMFLRFGVIVAIAVLGGIGSQMFEITGVSGDLIPIIRLKSAAPQAIVMETTFPGTEAETLPAAQLDFLQFLGSDRNAVLKGIPITPEHIKSTPKELWRQPIGQGWSGFVVEGPYAYTQEQAGEKESITCYQLSTGHLIWRYDYTADYSSVIAGNGPRATPTIAGEYLVTMGSTGILNCLRRSNGEPIWSHNVIKDATAKIPDWGFSPSPLVAESEVIVPAGEGGESSLRVYDLASGALLRSSPNVSASYSSPILAQWGEVTQLLYMYHKGFAGYSPDGEQQLWDIAWGSQFPDVAVPIVLPDLKVFISSGYGVGCALLQLKKSETGEWSTEQVWKQRTMKAKFTNVVARDGFVYGLDDGMMACINLENGRRQWKEGRYGHGQMFLLENAIMVLSEKGDVIWMEINPNEPKIISQWHALDGKTWNPPCLAWPYLLLRNDQEAVCFEFQVK